MPTIETNLTIDAMGLSCPMPLLKAKQGLSKLNRGETLRLLATDPGSERDIQAFAKLSDHTLVSHESTDGCYQYIIQKG
ncbi:sulfurtransferase TusA family protein [Teredinibacter franksiae]|jgi:Predicted redox protein, regulator of disulfide bond formation|uniref:sulfurtransferase TusA family protein n=1 Tax=Teredinibacter franksiae TaxID=2761453 RepID=UPI00162ACF0F|nr:sulfurtransferase TusA family protein [Teredinibacter franksiae]